MTSYFSKSKKRRFIPEVEDFVIGLLNDQYSPKAIVGVAKVQAHGSVSNEYIYKSVWKDKKQGGSLYLHFRTADKQYRKRSAAKDRRKCVVARVGIAQRPLVFDERIRVGNFEIDTFIGKNHQGAIVTINDRASGILKMIKVESRNSKILAKETINTIQGWKPYLKAITSHKRKEFVLHRAISDKLNIDFFFAELYHNWERGSNENLNGLIMQFSKKQISA